MERLTIRTPKGAAVKMGEPANESEARKMLMENFHKVCEKLAHYEDLEEAEKLVELPEALDKDSLLCIIAETTCPHCVGLSDWIGTERCYEFDNCQACWIESLKGGE